MTESAVDHPAHYNTGQIEVIDAIEELGLGFHLGNAVKYLARASYKGSQVEDLEKAIWYLDRAKHRGNLSTRTVPASRIEVAGLISDWNLPGALGSALACIITAGIRSASLTGPSERIANNKVIQDAIVHINDYLAELPTTHE